MSNLRLAWEPENLTPLSDIEARINVYIKVRGSVTILGDGTLLFLTNGDDDVGDAKKAAADKAEQAAQDPDSGLSDAARLALIDQAIALRREAQTISADWGVGGTYRQITTALAAAAGGNVTASSGAMLQGMVVNYLQQQGASYIGQLVANGTLIERHCRNDWRGRGDGHRHGYCGDGQ